MNRVLPQAESPPSIRRRLVAVALVMWVALISFRVVWVQAMPGVDPSWAWAINAAGHQSFAFGRDLVWMWGPLGYLLWTQPMGDHFFYSALTAWGLHAIFLSCLVYRAWHARRLCAVVCFATGYAASVVLGLLPEHPLIGIFALLAAVALEPGRQGVICFASVLAAVIVFVKLSAGVVSMAYVGLTLLVCLIQKRPHAWRHAVLSVLLFVSTTALLAKCLFATWHDFARWGRLSFELVSGYDEAISVLGPSRELFWALFLLTFILAAAIYARKTGLGYYVPMAVSAFGLYACYKHGFVRHDSPHFRSFSCGTLIITSVWALGAQRRREVRLCASLMAATLLVAFLAERHIKIDPARAFAVLSTRQASQAIKDATHPSAMTAALQTMGQANLKSFVLPADWLAAIDRAGGRLTPVPLETAWCAANAVRCAPIPTLQLLASYTATLDAANAAFIDATEVVPTSILLEFGAIDAHNMLWEAPMFWQRVLSQYEIVKRDADKLLLQRRAKPLALPATSLAPQTHSLGAWIDMPASDQLLFAAFELEPSALGKLVSALYKLPSLMLEMRLTSGEVVTHRLIRRVAGGGLVANVWVSSLSDIDELWMGRPQHRVAALRVVAEKGRTYAYRNAFTLRWDAGLISLGGPLSDRL